jgi:predicted transcriptional regulator
MKNSIFDHICKRVAWATYVSTVPSTEIAKVFNITLYKARKYIKELVEEGWLVSNIEVLCCYPPYDDEYYPPRIYRGYTLTRKGFETDNYKKHYEECMKSYERWAGDDCDE